MSPGKGLKIDPDMKPVLEVLISDSEAAHGGSAALLHKKKPSDVTRCDRRKPR